MRVGPSLELDGHPKKNYIMGQANRLASEKRQALSPDGIGVRPTPDASQEPGSFLVGKSFEDVDTQTGRSTTCHVHECGTSPAFLDLKNSYSTRQGVQTALIGVACSSSRVTRGHSQNASDFVIGFIKLRGQ
ncbi:hypothetical protein F5I97DRAFT_1831671 [Phlebopus sp. FC_14]|nr:hypothetical protein F5I97DRAFT_1831671 [Phlebopus sp. FC_14]